MKPTIFEGHNVMLLAPESMPEVMPLPVRRVEGAIPEVTSCWELEPGDLETIQRTGRVYLTVQGRTHPPLRVSALPPEE